MEELNPKISVIVPVYNVERFIKCCIESILSQTFTNFELLLIDDGSKDNSGIICDEYAKRNSRIRVLHKENAGVTSARSLGVQECNGEYVFFIDSDDYIPQYALQILTEASSEQYDIIIGRSDNGQFTKQELTVEEFRSYAIKGIYFPCVPWGKLIKRTLLTPHIFDIPRSIVKGEDMLMNIRLAFANTKKVRLINTQIYHYRINPESCCHTFQDNLQYEILYDKYRKFSIPVEEYPHYIKECILSKLYGLSQITDTSHNNTWKDSLYFKELMADAKNNNIKIPLLLRIKLYTKNKVIMKIAAYANKIDIKIKKIFNKKGNEQTPHF